MFWESIRCNSTHSTKDRLGLWRGWPSIRGSYPLSRRCMPRKAAVGREGSVHLMTSVGSCGVHWLREPLQFDLVTVVGTPTRDQDEEQPLAACNRMVKTW